MDPTNPSEARRVFFATAAPAEIEPAIESALARVARELVAIAEAIERLESLVALIASAAVPK